MSRKKAKQEEESENMEHCRACYPESCKKPEIPVFNLRVQDTIGGFTTYNCHAASEEEAIQKCRKFFKEEAWVITKITGGRG